MHEFEVLDETKTSQKKGKKKKRSKLLTALLIILIFILVIGIAGILFVNFYLNKINYDPNGKVDPDIANTDLIELPDEYKYANDDLRANFDDNEIWYHDDVKNILLIGCDYGDDKLYYPRSDTMIIISINKVNNSIKMVSISRASYVAIPGYGNKRLNMAYASGGPELLVETIEKNYKVRIDQYVSVDFDGFIKIIDVLGGVNINLTEIEANALKQTLNKKNISYKGKGDYKLDGELALEYSRLRYVDSDRARTGRQRNVLMSIVDSYKTVNVSQALDTLDTVLPYLTTNFSKTQLISQGVSAVGYLRWNISQDIIPHNPLPLTLKGSTEVLIIDWAKSNKYLHDILYPDMQVSYKKY